MSSNCHRWLSKHLYIAIIAWWQISQSAFSSTEPIKFAKYFRELFATGKYAGEIRPKYLQLRGNMRRYDQSFKGNPINFANREFKTNFVNNIWINAIPRIKAFLSFVYEADDHGDDDALHQTLQYLSNADLAATPNETMLQAMHDHLGYDGKFVNVKDNYFK